MLAVHTIPYTVEIEASWIPRGIKLFLRREDVIHPQVSGNKWRKLKYNLSEAHRSGATTLVTFGGAYSNHIYATAAAAKEAGFHSVGIVRGEETSAHNYTLSAAKKLGMELIFTDRASYRDKTALENKFKGHWENAYFIPEGGSNCVAVKGCEEMADEELRAMKYVAVAAGTGGTAAGIISGMPEGASVLAFNVLRGDFMPAAIENLLHSCHIRPQANWKVIDAHYGGYARITGPLLTFIREFYEEQKILLDPVYTGKMLYRLKSILPEMEPGSTVCAIHTGGLQGWQGMKERYGIIPPDGSFSSD